MTRRLSLRAKLIADPTSLCRISARQSLSRRQERRFSEKRRDMKKSNLTLPFCDDSIDIENYTRDLMNFI